MIYNQAISLIIPLIVKNNAGKAAIVLRKAGYTASDYIPASELEAKLFQIHTADPELFYAIIKEIPWNYGDSATNTPEIKDRLIILTQEQILTDVSKENWWQNLILLLEHQSQLLLKSDSLRISSSGTSIWKVLLLLLAIIIAILLIIRM